MHPVVHLVRWFNHVSPWNHLKPSLGKRAANLLEPAPGLQVCHNIAGGLDLKLDLSLFYERWIYLNCYEVATVNLLRRLLRPGDAMVDAGAHIGLMTLIGWQQVRPGGKVYSFDPNPASLERLRENIALNHAAEVTVIPKGVWRQSGQSELFSFTDGTIAEASLHAHGERPVSHRTMVDLVRIDDAVAEPVKVLKMDVEGAELAALEGAQRTIFGPHPPHLIMELNPATCKAFGYEPVDLIDYVLKGRPDYRVHRVRGRRTNLTTRDEFAAVFAQNPRKKRDIWFEPPA